MQKKINTYIDSTFLKTAEEMNISDSENELIVFKMLDDAIRSNYACFMIRPNYVKKVCDKIKSLKSSLKVGTVVDFPLGTSSTKCKVSEAKQAISNGAYDIDFVSDYNAFKRGDFKKFDDDIIQATDICFQNDCIAKWIIETGALSREEIKNISHRIANIIDNNFPQYSSKVFVKTSTGYYGGFGATVKDIKLMKSVVGSLKLKASGGISSYNDALMMISAGANRIGTSKAKEINI